MSCGRQVGHGGRDPHVGLRGDERPCPSHPGHEQGFEDAQRPESPAHSTASRQEPEGGLITPYLSGKMSDDLRRQMATFSRSLARGHWRGWPAFCRPPLGGPGTGTDCGLASDTQGQQLTIGRMTGGGRKQDHLVAARPRSRPMRLDVALPATLQLAFHSRSQPAQPAGLATRVKAIAQLRALSSALDARRGRPAASGPSFPRGGAE